MVKKKKQDYNHHELVPKHEKLNEKAKKELLKQYNCAIDQLPKIFSTDAAIIHDNPKAGDIYKISRFSRTEGISTFYRVIIDG